jgi:response regulator RpfG family c-di-GMP phosphodiesterase
LCLGGRHGRRHGLVADHQAGLQPPGSVALVQLRETFSIEIHEQVAIDKPHPPTIYRLGREQVQVNIFLFSPLHDIGKIGIPDSILLKAGLLDPDECEVMKTNSEKGRQLIDSTLRDFGLEDQRGNSK